MVERQQFQNMLDQIQKDIIKMGGLVEESIDKAIESLKKQDLTLAEEAYQLDKKIDKLELSIEDACIQLIATQQPAARDLRKISSSFKIIHNLERMGDYAQNIARTTLTIGDEPLIKPLIDLPRMALIAQKMVRNSLEAFIQENEDLAKQVGEADDEVDQLHSQIYNELLLLMIKSPSTINQATHLLFISRALERIADHATDIAERVIYVVSGVHENLN